MNIQHSIKRSVPLLSIGFPWRHVPPDPYPPTPAYTWVHPMGGPGLGTTLGEQVNALMPYVFAISGLVLLIMIVFSGYQLLTSAGNPEGMEKGKKRLTAALVGFILIFAAFWIYQLIGVIIGYDFTT